MTALYIHLPFCAQKCAYCDFSSYAGRAADFSRYLAGLEAEMADAARVYGRMPVGTIFLGGGTPSLLPSDAVLHLIAMARARFSVSADAEITVECNPGTVTREKLRDYMGAGVNRLSFGMQSASARLLHLIGRIHDHAQTVEAVRTAQGLGFQNINLDLIYALPTQSMAEWAETVQAALALDVPHLSLYSLILEAGTPLFERVQSGALPAPEEETTLRMQHAAARMLMRRGLKRYEISNYAKDGFMCRHNLAYWRRGDYLGLGCAAHSLMRGARFANTSELDLYLTGVREVSREVLSAQDIFEERVMLGTRLSEGVEAGLLRGREKKVESLRGMGLMKVERGRAFLTERGMDVQDAVVLELIGEE